MEQPIRQFLSYLPCPKKTQLRGLGGDQPSEVTESWTCKYTLSQKLYTAILYSIN